jgi:cation diffusion facilitator CzcD-associated flavoprotein CzcO
MAEVLSSKYLYLTELTFAPNHKWSEYYASGAEIRAYYESLVKEYGIDTHLKLRHEVLSAVWSDDIGEWVVQVKNLNTGQIFTETANFFVSAAGRLNEPKFPNIPGLDKIYEGIYTHTAQWTDDLTRQLEGKSVAVIGNGASGQQILTNILDKAAHIDHYVRSKQWIVSALAPNLVTPTPDTPGGHIFTEAEKESFEKHPEIYLEYRRSIEKNFHGRYQGSIAGSKENNEIRQRFEEALWNRVGGDKGWFDRLVPDFAPGCKRPIPSASYVDAIRSYKVDYVDHSEITHATATGLVTADGKERPVDIIIAATGFKNGFLPLFPTIGKNGLDLRKHWADDGPIGYPATYFGVMAPLVPNYFTVCSVCYFVSFHMLSLLNIKSADVL